MSKFFKKIKKLFTKPNLYFYDLFRKRLNSREKKIAHINDNNIKNTNKNKDQDVIELINKLSQLQKLLNILCRDNLITFQKLNSCKDVWDYLKTKKILFRNYMWCNHYKNFFKNIIPIDISEYDNSFSDIDCMLIHGMGQSYENSLDISSSMLNGIEIYNSEDGFLHSIVRPSDKNYSEMYRIGCSLVIDSKGFYFDSTKPSDLENLLNSNFKLNDEELNRARKNIDFITTNYISKYNNQPIKKLDIGRKNAKKVLVVDQAVSDFSIKLGSCTEHTFLDMLLSAINENPESDILVKVHPDMINCPTRGGRGNKKYGHFTDFDFSQFDNVYLIAEYINPISLLHYVDKVYVATSQLGFEALMCNKEVVIFGLPFYAGWGCGELRNTSSNKLRRKTYRTVEEIFYITYILYVHYAHPMKKEICSIEEITRYLVDLRNIYMNEFNIENNTINNIKERQKNICTTINICFSFDQNYYKQAIVAILSLLDSDCDSNKFNIYCLHSTNLNKKAIDEINEYVKNHNNLKSISFFDIDKFIVNAHETRGISRLTYGRLFIHRILDTIDKAIFSDIDVIFNNKIDEVYNIDCGNNLLGACIDVGQNLSKTFNSRMNNLWYWKKYMSNLKGRYFSAGFLLLNLQKIRERSIDDMWSEMINYKFEFQDMDIINATINDYIFPIHQKYCAIPRLIKSGKYEEATIEGYLPKTQIEQMLQNPSIYHFAGKKPWDDKNVIGAEIWWNYVKNYPKLYSYFNLRYAKNNF